MKANSQKQACTLTRGFMYGFLHNMQWQARDLKISLREEKQKEMIFIEQQPAVDVENDSKTCNFNIFISMQRTRELNIREVIRNIISSCFKFFQPLSNELANLIQNVHFLFYENFNCINLHLQPLGFEKEIENAKKRAVSIFSQPKR